MRLLFANCGSVVRSEIWPLFGSRISNVTECCIDQIDDLCRTSDILIIDLSNAEWKDVKPVFCHRSIRRIPVVGILSVDGSKASQVMEAARGGIDFPVHTLSRIGDLIDAVVQWRHVVQDQCSKRESAFRVADTMQNVFNINIAAAVLATETRFSSLEITSFVDALSRICDTTSEWLHRAVECGTITQSTAKAMALNVGIHICQNGVALDLSDGGSGVCQHIRIDEALRLLPNWEVAS